MRWLVFLSVCLGCASSTPVSSTEGGAEAPPQTAHDENTAVVAHGAPGESHVVHGRPHHGGDHATVDHSFADAEKWAAVFDDPARDAWQKPAELVAALQLAPGSTVADVGAGTGYFNPHLSRAVGVDGRVIAVDIEQSLVDWMNERARKEETANVEARLGRPDSPGLQAGEVDVVMLVDTYHHINERVIWFSRLKESVKPGGRLVIVDFRPGDIPVGPPESHRIPQEKVVAELVEAGWIVGENLDLLPYQFVQTMTRQ